MYRIPRHQRPIKKFLVVLFSAIGLMLAGITVIHYMTNIPFASFTADPAATLNYNPLIGFISNIGILLWCACASVCFLSAGLLSTKKDGDRIAKFLFYFGVLTAVLMLDDLFMFHESLAKEYMHISEKLVLLCYGAYFLGCTVHFRRIIFTHDLRYMILAMAFFGLSVLLDQVSERIYMPGEYLMEDGFKLLGIASWLMYFLDLSFNKVTFAMAKTQTSQVRDNGHNRLVYEQVEDFYI